jgi:flagellar P-ring protein precursor FlgI
MMMRLYPCAWIAFVCWLLLAFSPSALGQAEFSQAALGQTELKVRDLCRLKGQEENVLQGVGFVVGLKGTGDGDGNKPMLRALTRALQNLGTPVASDANGRLIEKEMANAKNVAMVFVTVKVPPSGAEQGDTLNCTVSATHAKSLEGGTLLLTHLLGPRADRPETYALAQGALVVEDRRFPTTAKVINGCKIEKSIRTGFTFNDKITLVLDPDHASFTTSQYLEDVINDFMRPGNRSFSRSGSAVSSDGNLFAKALDQTHIEVTIPPAYRERPVQFVSLVLDIGVINLRGSRRVVINEREGTMIIGADVLVAPVAISHKNQLSISTSAPISGGFVGLSSRDGNNPPATLKNLVDALNVLNVATEDKIAIIKTLKRQGNLYGEIIFE